MSADKYPSISSRQMVTIVYIFSRQMATIVYMYFVTDSTPMISPVAAEASLTMVEVNFSGHLQSLARKIFS